MKIEGLLHRQEFKRISTLVDLIRWSINRMHEVATYSVYLKPKQRRKILDAITKIADALSDIDIVTGYREE